MLQYSVSIAVKSQVPDHAPRESIGPILASCGWLTFKFITRIRVCPPGLYETEWSGGRKTLRWLVLPIV